MNSLLIIDDDEDISDALFNLLEEEGYQVRRAASGLQGLELAHATVPQLILLDWQMPHMDGHQVLLTLASIPKLAGVPVILMSANIASIPAAILKNRQHLSKPFDADVLIRLVAQQMKNEKPQP